MRLIFVRKPTFVTPVTSITQVLSATNSADATIDFPGGIQAGDLIVLFDNCFNISTPADVTPTGFTRIGSSATTSSVRSNLWYKLATGSESGALTCMGPGLVRGQCMYVFRGNVPATTITPGSAAQQATDGNPTLQTVTASSGVAPLVVIGAYACPSGTVDPRTFSTTKDGEISPAGGFYLAYKIYNSSPANSDIDMDDEGGGNSLHSCYIQMA